MFLQVKLKRNCLNAFYCLVLVNFVASRKTRYIAFLSFISFINEKILAAMADELDEVDNG